nr:DUF2828 domain-containing protein [Tanacetum cinerariifolium]
MEPSHLGKPENHPVKPPTYADIVANFKSTTISSFPPAENKSPTLSQIAITTTSLLGPPEIRQFIEATDPPPTSTIVSHPYTEAMVSGFNSIASSPNPPMGYTENMSATFLSTGNPCLDFFFHVVPDTPPETIKRRLQEAWKHDPLKTLKLICNLRGVRGTGKSDKEGFYTCALWLHKNHPRTLACNVASIADFG